jgi:sulfur-carrier protein
MPSSLPDQRKGSAWMSRTAHELSPGWLRPMRPDVEDWYVPTGTIRYWAAAREAAGVAEEPYDASTLADALAAAAATRDERFGRVLRRSSYLVDGTPVGTRAPSSVELAEGAVIEVLPPFAGG